MVFAILSGWWCSIFRGEGSRGIFNLNIFYNPIFHLLDFSLIQRNFLSHEATLLIMLTEVHFFLLAFRDVETCRLPLFSTSSLSPLSCQNQSRIILQARRKPISFMQTSWDSSKPYSKFSSWTDVQPISFINAVSPNEVKYSSRATVISPFILHRRVLYTETLKEC